MLNLLTKEVILNKIHLFFLNYTKLEYLMCYIQLSRELKEEDREGPSLINNNVELINKRNYSKLENLNFHFSFDGFKSELNKHLFLFTSLFSLTKDTVQVFQN